MNFNALYTVVAMMFVLMTVGFVCRKLNIITDQALKVFSKIMLALGQPAMIINALAKTPYSQNNLKIAGLTTLLGLVLHAVLAILGYLGALPLRKFTEKRNIAEFAFIFANCAFIGFPIFNALFPELGSFMTSFLIISFQIYVWTWGLAIFARDNKDIKISVKSMFINLGTVPCAIGIVFFLLKHPSINFVLPEFITDALGYLQGICTPLSLLMIGALIAKQKPKQIFRSWHIYYFNVIKLFVMPLIVCLICKLLGIPYLYAMFATAAAALPSAASATMFAETYGGDSEYAALTVGTSSLISVLSIPFILMIAEWIFAL
jgi:predicted permease